MQYSIRNTCGHLRTYQLYGSSQERERKAAWLKTVPCPACRQRQELTTGAYLAEREAQVEQDTQRILAVLAGLDNEERAQAIRSLRHQLAEGLGTETRREAARRALERLDR